MKKTNKKIIISIALIIITILQFTNYALAIENPDSYNPSPNISADTSEFIIKAGKILGWIQWIGIITSIIVLAIIGLKYMFGSIEEKAEYKKTMFPYIVGCFMISSICVVIKIIEWMAT